MEQVVWGKQLLQQRNHMQREHLLNLDTGTCTLVA